MLEIYRCLVMAVSSHFYHVHVINELSFAGNVELIKIQIYVSITHLPVFARKRCIKSKVQRDQWSYYPMWPLTNGQPPESIVKKPNLFPCAYLILLMAKSIRFKRGHLQHNDIAGFFQAFLLQLLPISSMQSNVLAESNVLLHLSTGFMKSFLGPQIFIIWSQVVIYICPAHKKAVLLKSFLYSSISLSKLYREKL